MAKDQKDTDTKGKEDEKLPESNGSGNQPPPLESGVDIEPKEQNGNQPSALLVSDAKTTITILRNRALRHNGIEYKGGTTLDLPTKDADFLIKHHYGVAGSLLPEGGIIVPKTHIPKAGSDVS